MTMTKLLVVGVVLLAATAQAQIGVLSGSFGIDGTPDFACVGEPVRSVVRFSNDDSHETFSVFEERIVIHHASGDDDSGNLLTAPVDVTGPAGFADSAFVWIARPEDV